jgi:hypothetical protein
MVKNRFCMVVIPFNFGSLTVAVQLVFMEL